jgi:hypothetical protein
MFSRLKQLFTPQPPREYLHPTFGRFEACDDVWTATIQHGTTSFQLSLGGSDSAPDDRLLSAASRLLPRFDELRDSALAFITAQEQSARREHFTIYGLDLLFEDRPDDFTLEFEMAGDIDGIWRVEFESGAPKFLGRDD